MGGFNWKKPIKSLEEATGINLSAVTSYLGFSADVLTLGYNSRVRSDAHDARVSERTLMASFASAEARAAERAAADEDMVLGKIKRLRTQVDRYDQTRGGTISTTPIGLMGMPSTAYKTLIGA
jgi:hypothetical protein